MTTSPTSVPPTDSDGLAYASDFDEIDQTAARIGSVWFHLDSRIPWQLAQCMRNNSRHMPLCRLRLDPTRVTPAAQYRSRIRKAHWWGPAFSWDAVDLGRTTVETVHGDPANLLQRLNGFVAKTVFRWDFPQRERIGILQIEEFSAEVPNPAAITTRYLHSIRDRTERHFTHLDGAIKTYSADTYAAAYRGESVKSGRYEKLFRVDGRLAEDFWWDCVAAFFARNVLVAEYFGKDERI